MFVESRIVSDVVFKPWYVQHPVVFLQPERECTNCHEWWPLDSEFWYVLSCNPEGFTKQCRACLSEKRVSKIAASEPPVCKVKPVYSDEKACSSCKIIKKLNTDNFKLHTDYPDGYQAQCKVCVNARARASRAIKRKERENAKLLLKASTPKPAPKPRKRKSRAKAAMLLCA
jgi:hypothetical protein